MSIVDTLVSRERTAWGTSVQGPWKIDVTDLLSEIRGVESRRNPLAVLLVEPGWGDVADGGTLTAGVLAAPDVLQDGGSDLGARGPRLPVDAFRSQPDRQLSAG